VTYVQGQRATLRTTITDESGQLSDATVVLTVTAPDGTASTPTVTRESLGVYSAAVTFTQAGDWLRVWTTSGAIVSSDVDQIHVIAPALRLVGLAEVKEHGNITSTASDRELLDFIGTAQQMIELEVGPTVPQTFTETVYACGNAVILGRHPVLSVTSITEYGAVVDPSLYAADLSRGIITRLDGRHWYADATYPLTYTYRAGRSPIPEALRWAGKELTIHLWRSTQAQRGGRGRGDDPGTAAPFGLPNRVADALVPFLRAATVA
jgi:hypothetical protein